MTTSEEAREFASRFTKLEWDILINNRVFRAAFPEDLKRCRPMAEQILKDYHEARSKPNMASR